MQIERNWNANMKEDLTDAMILSRYHATHDYLVRHADYIERGLADNPVYYAVQYETWYHRVDAFLPMLEDFSPVLLQRYLTLRDSLDRNLRRYKEENKKTRVQKKQKATLAEKAGKED
jgi:hypothetical protein